MTIHRTKTALVALLGLGVLGGGAAAIAQSGNVTDEAELREMRAVEGAGVTLDAIVAEAETRSGGRVIEAGAEDEQAGVVYIVDVALPDGLTEEMRFGLDGSLLTSGTPMESEEDEGLEVEPDALATASTTLSQGIAAAQAETGGTVLEAGYEQDDGRLVIEVETVQGDALTEVAIDARTGAVIEVGDD